MTTPDYQTADLNCAAFLMSQGHALLSVDREGSRCTFHYPPEAREDSQAFYRNAPTPARAFANAIRDLKALIRET
ncbi:MAG: hypothetical protein HY725_14265 [Candidatus Rokubacteria bacterium]|nr:hypothetical protein [Candidatus Rokubacteria bacterium]